MMKIKTFFLLGMVIGGVYADKLTCYKALDSGDYTNAVNQCRRPALFGDATAQYNLGVIYDQGLTAAPDYNSAVYWFIRAANQSTASIPSSMAQYNLGLMYFYGNKIKLDYSQALIWFSRAANQRNAPSTSANAQYYLGIMYLNGLGVAKNHATAIYWLNQAAQGGNTDAATTLRSMNN